MNEAPSIVVVGGGIAGLAAAHRLLALGARVTLVESDRRLGGKIRSEALAGHHVDVGAESLLTRAPAAVELCRELGLAQELVTPTTTATSVWARGRLRKLPPGILGGLPEGPRSVVRSGILSPLGVARASLDLVLPATSGNGDRPVGELVQNRLGRQALERLVDPLLGTIYAASCDSLSLRATAPQLEAIASEHRSLIRGASARRPERGAGARRPERVPSAKAPASPMFVTLPGGLQRMIAALERDLDGVDIRTGTRAHLLTHSSDGSRYALILAGGQSLSADGVVLATPARSSARLLAGVAPSAAQELREIGLLSSVVVTLRYPSSAMRERPAEAGFLVPSTQERLLGACTWLSSKWPHFAMSGDLWLRCSVARDRVAEALSSDDAELVEGLGADLRRLAGVRGAPLDVHVMRWMDALPHYATGHLERVARIERHLKDLPGVALAGSSYRGIGVPQCIAQGRAAAGQVLAAGSLRHAARTGRERMSSSRSIQLGAGKS